MATIFKGYRRIPFWHSDEMIALTTRNIKSPHIEVRAIYRQFCVSHHRPHNIMTQPSPPRVHIPHPCGTRTIISLFDSSHQTPQKYFETTSSNHHSTPHDLTYPHAKAIQPRSRVFLPLGQHSRMPSPAFASPTEIPPLTRRLERLRVAHACIIPL